MVTRYGMSDELGPMVYGENEGEVFLGRSITTQKNVSEATMQKVDQEIRKIIDQQYAVARKLLEDNRDKVEAMAKALLELETIDADQISDIMARQAAAPAEARRSPRPDRHREARSSGPEVAPSTNPSAEGSVRPARGVRKCTPLCFCDLRCPLQATCASANRLSTCRTRA